MSKSKQLAKNTLIIGAGRLSTQFLTLLLLPVYTAFLSTEEYGQLDLILIYVAVAAPVLTAQMEMAVFRHLIDARTDVKKMVSIISSALGILLLGILLSVGAFLAIHAFVHIQSALFVCLLFASIVLLNYLLKVARGIGRNDLFAIASLATGITSTGLGIYFVVMRGMGIDGVLAAGIVGNVVGLAFLTFVLKIWQYVKPTAMDRSEVSRLLGYSWPLTLNHLGLWAINGLSRTAVAIIAGLSAVGILAAAGKIPLIYTALFSIFAMAWTEAAAVHISSHDKDTFFSKVADTTMRLFGSAAIFITAAVGVAFPLLISANFSEARPLIPILIIGAFFGSVVAFYGAIYLAIKKTKEVAKMTSLAVILTLIITAAGVPIIGVTAAALALAITYIYLSIVRYRDIKKYVAIRYSTSTFWALSATSAIVIYLYYIDNVYAGTISILVAGFCAVYLNQSSFGIMRKTILNKAGSFKNDKRA